MNRLLTANLQKSISKRIIDYKERKHSRRLSRNVTGASENGG